MGTFVCRAFFTESLHRVNTQSIRLLKGSIHVNQRIFQIGKRTYRV